MATVESVRLRARVRVEVDRRTQNTGVNQWVEDLEPARTTRRNEGLETRRQARSRVRQRITELATARDREAQHVLRIVIEQAEQCAIFIDAKGKYAVKQGEYNVLKLQCDAITERGIGATIEVIAK